MVIFDGIITELQMHGGITVYFNEIIDRVQKEYNLKYIKFASDKKFAVNAENTLQVSRRFFERYRDCICTCTTGVFHSTYYRLPSNKNLKVVTTVHDFTYEKFIQGPAKWVHSWQKYRAIKNSDIVICVSHNTAKDLMHYCPIDKEKIRVIYNGISDSYFPLNDGTRITNEVLFVGSRKSYKNFALAVDVLSRLSELSLSIVGGGQLTNSEMDLLNSRIPNRFQWLDFLTDEELNFAYNRAYALLYPSSYEGFGIPIIEAMRTGCPVVAVAVSSIPEVAGDAALLVNAPNLNDLVDALKSVDSKRDQLKLAGFKQAKKFSWDQCFQETLQVYKELM